MIKKEDLKTTREAELKGDKLLKLLTKKEELVGEGRKFQVDIEGLQKEQRKVGLKLNKVKEKVIPLIEKESEKLDIEQFEIPSSVNIKDGKAILTILDQIADYKFRILEQLEKKDEEGEQTK